MLAPIRIALLDPYSLSVALLPTLLLLLFFQDS